MKYTINLKNVKQSVAHLNESLKEFNIPHNKMLDSFSKALYYKNWNTLYSLATNPSIISQQEEVKKYLFEIEANITKSQLLTLLKTSFLKANALLSIDNFFQNDCFFHIELNLKKSDTNILTAMFLLADSLKNHDVKKFDYCRIVCEKESFMDFYKNKKFTSHP
jgi:hypothetical protein